MGRPLHNDGGTFPDKGCDLHDSCLSCPLPYCRYDDSMGIRRLQSNERKAEILECYKSGMQPFDIAKKVGCSRETVYRIIRGIQDV